MRSNFEKKPPKRDYPDYYKLIERPTSISDVKILVRQGKIKDWDTLAKEVRLVWDNAKEYNEPGSDIYDMTESLEVRSSRASSAMEANIPQSWFEDQVQVAGAGPRAKAPRLSLSQPKRTQLKLKMGTPGSAISGGTVDNEALRRQKEEMAQAVNRANRTSSRGVTSTPAPLSTAPSMRSLSSVEPNGDTLMSGVNGTQVQTSRTPIPPPARQLPTPVMDGVPSGPLTPAPMVNGNHQPLAPPRNIFSESDNPMDRKFRDPGKGTFSFARLTSVYSRLHRSKRRTHLFCRIHDASKPSWRSKVEIESLCIRKQYADILIYLPPLRPFLPSAYTNSYFGVEDTAQLEGLCLVELADSFTFTACTRCIRLPTPAWREHHRGRCYRRAERRREERLRTTTDAVRF